LRALKMATVICFETFENLNCCLYITSKDSDIFNVCTHPDFRNLLQHKCIL